MFGVDPGAFGSVGLLMLLNEVFLGVWLIVKGFAEPVGKSGTHPGAAALMPVK